jgi:DNA-binding response OmpR family regulator
MNAMLQERGEEPVSPEALTVMEPANATILLVEDDRATRTFLADNLSADGYDVVATGCAADAIRLLETSYPDLALLDLGLPDRDGLELVSHVRAADRTAGRVDPDLPLLILSGRAQLDLLRGFRRGCDDFVSKPFDYAVLLARIAALLRRTRQRPAAGRIRVGSLEIDPLSRQVWVEGWAVGLCNKEFALLRALASEPTRVFGRAELLRGVWGYADPSATRTLDSHAARLRRKLNIGSGRFVINVWGAGYRLVDGAPPAEG